MEKKTYTKHKVTWRMVYTKFKKTHPRLSKMSCGFQPYNYAEILIYLNDGSKLTYNYDTCRVNFTPVIRPTRKQQTLL